MSFARENAASAASGVIATARVGVVPEKRGAGEGIQPLSSWKNPFLAT